MKIVIRAGGHGTRLWPLSRKHKPKQFHALFGEKVLLRMTFERVYALVASCDDVYVSCNEEYVEALGTILPEVPSKNYILEPEVRNTGPAIALETAYLRDVGVADDTVIATIPSDDFIGDEEAFRMLFRDCEVFLRSRGEYIVAPAAIPAVPSDGYSYITPGVLIDTVETHDFTLVSDWVEKPTQPKSRELIASGRSFAHVGMYLWQLGAAAKLFEQYQEAAWNTALAVVAAMRIRDGANVHELYEQLPKETIETMLIRHAPEVAMVVDSQMRWSDIGKWQIVKHLLEPKTKEGSVHKGKVVAHDSSGNLVMAPSGKLVALVGVNDVVVIDTEDALLVCPAERSGDVKELLKKIEKIEGGRHL